MSQRRSLLEEPIGFAHRGGRAHAPDNSMEAFENALAMGATGLETDARVTRDGVTVLEHAVAVRKGWLWRTPERLNWGDLPEATVTLASIYKRFGTNFDLSVDAKTPDAGPEAIAVAHDAEEGAEERLWLCHWHVRRLQAWRLSAAAVRLVNSTRPWMVREGLDARARRLAALRIDAMNLREDDWNAELVEVVHAHGVLAFAYRAHTAAALERVLGLGVDAVYCDDVSLMMDAIRSR